MQGPCFMGFLRPRAGLLTTLKYPQDHPGGCLRLELIGTLVRKEILQSEYKENVTSA